MYLSDTETVDPASRCNPSLTINLQQELTTLVSTLWRMTKVFPPVIKGQQPFLGSQPLIKYLMHMLAMLLQNKRCVQ